MCCNLEHGEKLSQYVLEINEALKKMSEIKSEILIYFVPLLSRIKKANFQANHILII